MLEFDLVAQLESVPQTKPIPAATGFPVKRRLVVFLLQECLISGGEAKPSARLLGLTELLLQL